MPQQHLPSSFPFSTDTHPSSARSVDLEMHIDTDPESHTSPSMRSRLSLFGIGENFTTTSHQHRRNSSSNGSTGASSKSSSEQMIPIRSFRSTRFVSDADSSSGGSTMDDDHLHHHPLFHSVHVTPRGLWQMVENEEPPQQEHEALLSGEVGRRRFNSEHRHSSLPRWFSRWRPFLFSSDDDNILAERETIVDDGLHATRLQLTSSRSLSKRSSLVRRWLRFTCRFLPITLFVLLTLIWIRYRQDFLLLSKPTLSATAAADAQRAYYLRVWNETAPAQRVMLLGEDPLMKHGQGIQLHDPYRVAETDGPRVVDPIPFLSTVDGDTRMRNDFLPAWYPLTTPAERLSPIESHAWIVGDETCLDEWIAHGMLCDALNLRRQPGGRSTLTEETRTGMMDIVFTWVNGSDPLHQQASRYWTYCLTSSSISRDRFCPIGTVSTGNGSSETTDDQQQQPYILADESESQLQAKLTDWLREVYPLIRAEEFDQQPVKDAAFWGRKSVLRQIGAMDMRFVEMDELRYAIRSAIKFIPELRTVHIVSPDFPAWSLGPMAEEISRETDQSQRQILAHLHDTWDSWTAADGSARVGQKPLWLDTNAKEVIAGALAEKGGEKTKGDSNSIKGPQLRLHHDWSVFSPAGLEGDHKANILRKHIALPTFNSMAVESVLDGSTLPGLADTSLAANDDFFLLRPLSAADVVSPLYGTLLRFQDDLVVEGQSQQRWTSGGEWPGLKFASHLLDERFGHRSRRYPSHVHRAMSRSLLHEARLMFREELARTAKARFRGVGPNLVNHFLTFNMIIERHREAVLWIYFLMTLDANRDGQIDPSEWQFMRETMRNSPEGAPKNTSSVFLPRRSTIDAKRLDQNHLDRGMQPSQSSKYLFSSNDGYPVAKLARQAFQTWSYGPQERPRPQGSKVGWPIFLPEKEKPVDTVACIINWDACLAPIGVLDKGNERQSEALFKRFAFEKPSCGDCLLTHLVQQSGELGLAAVLPSGSAKMPGDGSSATTFSEPHLPLSRKWSVRPSSSSPPRERVADFSLDGVAQASGWQGRSMRVFAQRMLMRYSYILATTETRFIQLSDNVQSAKSQLRGVTMSKDIALLCVNDDLEDHSKSIVPEALHRWFSQTYPAISPFEKP